MTLLTHFSLYYKNKMIFEGSNIKTIHYQIRNYLVMNGLVWRYQNNTQTIEIEDPQQHYKKKHIQSHKIQMKNDTQRITAENVHNPSSHENVFNSSYEFRRPFKFRTRPPFNGRRRRPRLSGHYVPDGRTMRMCNK